MRALGQNPTNKDVSKILGNPTADGETPSDAFDQIDTVDVITLCCSGRKGEATVQILQISKITKFS